MHIFLRLAKPQYSITQRVLALILEHLAFLLAIPYAFIALSALGDQLLGIRRFNSVLCRALAVPLVLAGGLLASWTILLQILSAQGTPNPIMPTKEIVTRGPYAHIRNPMALGATVLYLGFSVWTGSPSGVLITVASSSLVLLYDRLIEEKELELRFGQAYIDYQRRTPFIIPTCRPRRTRKQ